MGSMWSAMIFFIRLFRPAGGGSEGGPREWHLAHSYKPYPLLAFLIQSVKGFHFKDWALKALFMKELNSAWVLVPEAKVRSTLCFLGFNNSSLPVEDFGLPSLPYTVPIKDPVSELGSPCRRSCLGSEPLNDIIDDPFRPNPSSAS